jgi:hypothetical protein
MLADGHFLREEKFLVPLLELLPALATGERGPHPSRAAKMLQGLKPALDQFAAEHAALAGALRELMVAAEAAGKAEYFDLAEELMLHNRTEEEVLYPAAMVAGNFVRLLNAEQ